MEDVVYFRPQVPSADNKVHPAAPAYTYERKEPVDTSDDVSEEEWDSLLMSPESAQMLIEMADKAMQDFEAGRTTPLGAGK